MNIIVRPYGESGCYCRPDTTWERENKDFYVPEGIMEVRWAPVVFVRISKAGKCIGQKFVSRYYDSFNAGALLYCQTDTCDEPVAFTSCADHSSLLPSPSRNAAELDEPGTDYDVMKDSVKIFEADLSSMKTALEEAICAASKLTSLRIGDYVAVEMSPVSTLATSENKVTSLKISSADKTLYDINIIF
jgi:hypothetical protein